MPHYSVRYTRLQPPPYDDRFAFNALLNREHASWPLPQIREIVCAENEDHARSMLGFADPNLPIFVSKTRSPVTLNRYCACQRVS